MVGGRQEILARFGAVRSAMYLYVNGKKYGYSEDSKTPAEWDITQSVHPGQNRVAVMVMRFCDGSYLECQDMWRMSGITRDVYIYSTPRVHISDYNMVARLDERTGDGLVDLTVELSGRLAGHMAVEAELLDTSGNRVWSMQQRMEPHDWTTHFEGEGCRVARVHPWTAETPYLYTLIMRLENAGGVATETIGCKVGFRNVAIKEIVYQGDDTLLTANQLCVNGKPITIKGVNRHEHSPLTGQYVQNDACGNMIGFSGNQQPVDKPRRCARERQRGHNTESVHIRSYDMSLLAQLGGSAHNVIPSVVHFGYHARAILLHGIVHPIAYRHRIGLLVASQTVITPQTAVYRNRRIISFGQHFVPTARGPHHKSFHIVLTFINIQIGCPAVSHTVIL